LNFTSETVDGEVATDVGTGGRHGAHHVEARGIAVLERLDEHAVDGRERGGGGAESNAESEHGDQGEAGAAPRVPQRA